MTWRAARRQVFPEHVSQKLKHGEAVISEAHDCVTVLFSDIVGYTSMSTSVNTADVFDMLNKLYTAFDALSDKHGVYKVDTIGDGALPSKHLIPPSSTSTRPRTQTHAVSGSLLPESG